jgi:hypothetical protein
MENAPFVRSSYHPAAWDNAPVMARTTGVVWLVLLLAGFLLLDTLPGQAGGVRVAGLSLLWWYGGVLAPVTAALVALRCPVEPPSASPSDE